MEDLRKVNSMQLYYLWRNFAISLLCMGATIAGTHMLPYYMAPALSLFFCGVLYTMIWNNNNSGDPSNMTMPETMLFALLGYTFASVGFVILYVFEIFRLPNELIFFNHPYMPSLILLPSVLAASLYALFMGDSMPSAKAMHIRFGTVRERGYFGLLSKSETRLQLKNIVVLMVVLTSTTWCYYLNIYVNINQNGRDWYVFVWIVILLVILDEVYFMSRYYNLYLDLQEHNEIITPEEVRDMTARTYLRFYVICGEYVFIDRNAFDRLNQKKGVLDTPFITKRTINGIPVSDVRKIVEQMTGRTDGELKFFFGRQLPGVDKHSVLRYFYFLDGEISDYPDMRAAGEWMHFDELKKIYNDAPLSIGSNALNDLSRLSTIILTEKTYDEDGYRKNKIKSYRQTITFADVRKSKLDLQDDKWIRIANFNSDTKFFRLKKFFREMMGRKSKSPFHNESETGE